MKKVLIVVDVQNDFMPGGALPVSGGDEIVEPINEIMPEYDLVVLTQDWHPVGHSSFRTWPAHCVGGERGGEFHHALRTERAQVIIRKGDDLEVDSYSAFEDADGRDSGLASLIEGRFSEDEITVDVVGLAYDYCVKETAVSSSLYFDTRVLRDMTRPVNLANVEATETALMAAGVELA